MKKHIFIILLCIGVSCSAQQIFSLRPSETTFPEGSYQKDTNNELWSFEGTWEGEWDDKTVFITFKKLTKQYNEDSKYYRDYLIGKFKVVDDRGRILFDNTYIDDAQAKIKGHSFKRYGDRYSLSYIDPDLCSISGSIDIKFTDASKTELDWNLSYGCNMLTSACKYYHTGIPDSLPEEITLTKQ